MTFRLHCTVNADSCTIRKTRGRKHTVVTKVGQNNLLFVIPCTRGEVMGCIHPSIVVCRHKTASSPDPGCSISAKYLQTV